MNKLMWLSILTLTGLAGAVPAYQVRSYTTVNGKTQSIFAWCDSLSRVLALGNGSKTSLLHWAKAGAGLGTRSTSLVTVGHADPGAGQIYYPLKVVAGSRNGDSGFLHTSNIENVQDPAYRMTHINEFKLGRSVFSCRYVPQAAFMGVLHRRTVIIWDTGDTVTYATRNFDGTPGVLITDGLKRRTVEGGTSYIFNTKNGFTYQVLIDEYRPGSGAKLSVLKNSSLKSSEEFLVYSISNSVESKSKSK